MGRITTYICLALFALYVCTACGQNTGSEDEETYFYNSLNQEKDSEKPGETQETQGGAADERELYLIVKIDQIEESLHLYRYANGMEYRYYYGTGTRFHDKYGNRTTVMGFRTGAVITLGSVNDEGILREAQVSDRVWVYDDITRFGVEEERGIFEIAGSRYMFDEDTYVFSDERRVDMATLAQGDTLSVVGLDRKILSVNVTTGQGTIALKNTGLFEGSYLQLGTRIFAEITPDMQLSVEEGVYNLIVANNGWGGNREVTVERGKVTTVDLDELKGEGPKMGKIRFLVDVEGAVLIIDGEERDYAEPLELTYGEHVVGVVASGYDIWQRNLHVNSEESTIVIQLMVDGDENPGMVSTDGTGSTGNAQGGASGDGASSDQNDALVKAIQSLIESQQKQNELNVLRDLMTSTTL